MPEVPEGKGTCNSKGQKVNKTREWGIEKTGHPGAWDFRDSWEWAKQAMTHANKEAVMSGEHWWQWQGARKVSLKKCGECLFTEKYFES